MTTQELWRWIRRLVAVGAMTASAWSQILDQTARLQTADTQLTVKAGDNSPSLVGLNIPGGSKWVNRNSETLIQSVEIGESKAPVHWQLDRDASRTEEKSVSFVYENATPHLRLTWLWKVPAAYGPIEHQVRIENLGSQELWIPMQDSLAFDWQIDPQSRLEHLYIEKGADRPSPIGTHEVPVTEGYRWTGTSSTYGDLRQDEPREIIPWSLIESRDSAQSGWYAGIEFSGRTHVSLERKEDSLHGSLGLNPDPSPFRTRLAPGESFETPVVFLGGFRHGADGAGKQLASLGAGGPRQSQNLE